MAREERRMAVQPSERRDRERVRGDLPGEAHADDEVRTERCEQRRHPGATRREDDVELRRQAAQQSFERELRAVPVLRVADGEQADGLVSRSAQHCIESERDGQDPRHDDGAQAHVRMMRPPEDCACALTTISSTFTFGGRVSANMMQSAMSSGVSGSTPL